MTNEFYCYNIAKDIMEELSSLAQSNGKPFRNPHLVRVKNNQILYCFDEDLSHRPNQNTPSNSIEIACFDLSFLNNDWVQISV